jgi:nitroreductase
MVYKKYRALMLFIFSFFSFFFAQKRKPEYPTENFFVSRQSKYLLQRRLTNEQMQKKLMSLFEAARWAFSSYNNQPWSFVYVMPDSAIWGKTLALLVPYNRKWAQHAGALIVVTSRTHYAYNRKPALTHAFDTGVAVGNLTTQAVLLNLVVHPIEGFVYSAARKLFHIPDSHAIIAILAIGQSAAADADIQGMTCRDLAEFRKKDAHPTRRKHVKDFAYKDRFMS